MSEQDTKIPSAADIGAAVAAAQKPQYDAILDQLAGLKPAPAAPAAPAAPKVYTRAELDAAIAAGSMTQAQADQIIEQQIEARVTAKAIETVTGRVDGERKAQTIGEKLQGYRKAIPALTDRNSVEFKRAAEAYQDIVADLGAPANEHQRLALEHQALKRAFGSIEAIQAAASAGRREVTEDMSGAGQGAGAPEGDAPRGLDNRQKAHYRKMIDAGVYKDWKAVSAELESAQKRRARA